MPPYPERFRPHSSFEGFDGREPIVEEEGRAQVEGGRRERELPRDDAEGGGRGEDQALGRCARPLAQARGGSQVEDDPACTCSVEIVGLPSRRREGAGVGGGPQGGRVQARRILPQPLQVRGRAKRISA